MANAMQFTQLIAMVASSMEEEDLLMRICKELRDLSVSKLSKNVSAEKKTREDLKFLFVVYLAKYTWDNPFDLIKEADLIDRIKEIITTEKN